jgi:DNA-binding response OmpR family regulator
MTLHLTPRERLIIETLYEAGEPMKADALDMALPGAFDREALNSLKVQIAHIRAKLGKDFIVSPGYGKGYALSDRARRVWGAQ